MTTEDVSRPHRLDDSCWPNSNRLSLSPSLQLLAIRIVDSGATPRCVVIIIGCGFGKCLKERMSEVDARVQRDVSENERETER